MSEQRIYLDEKNGLVVETDNCKQDMNGTTTKITGEFTVSAEDVLKLFAIVNKKDVVYPYISNLYYIPREYNGGFIVTHDETIKKVVEASTKKIQERSKEAVERNIELRKKNNEIVVLRQKINAYNNSRHWWERKIKID